MFNIVLVSSWIHLLTFFRQTESEKDRIASIVNTALASDPESFKNTTSLKNLIAGIITDVT